MKTVLFIDPSESHQFLVQEELSEAGYKVATAKSNEEVLSAYEKFKPDLIILELQQKKAQDESFEKLKKYYPNIPWMGYSTFTQCPKKFRKWVHFYVRKSSEMGRLKRLVARLMNRPPK